MKKMKCILLFFVLWIGYSVALRGQSIHELTIGDKLPNMEVGNLYGMPDRTLFTADLIGDGPLIISFWATWCAPCIKEMQFLDSMMMVYPSLHVLAVTYQDSASIRTFFDKNKGVEPENIRISTNDTVFNKLFKHQALPHNVWIDRAGVVVATTAFDEMVERNIKEFVHGIVPDMEIKQDIFFDWRKPLHVPDSLLHFRSIFQPKMEGINTAGITTNYSGMGKPNKDRFLGFNLSRLALIWAAYTRDYSSNINYDLIELRVCDSAKYIWPEQDPILFAKSDYKNRTEWVKNNTFFYELHFPEKVDDDLFYEFMVRDINYNLGIEAHFEDQVRTCRVVTIDPTEYTKLHESDTSLEPMFFFEKNKLVIRNIPVKFLLSWIGQNSFNSENDESSREPFFNETGLDRISMEIDITGISLRNRGVWESCLGKFGFQFESKERLYPILVITEIE